MRKHIYPLLISILISACSSEQLKNVQIYENNPCINKSKSEAQHADCKKTPYKTYEQYQKDRKELIEGKENSGSQK